MIQISNLSSCPVRLIVNGVDHGPLIPSQRKILEQAPKMTVTLRPIKESRTRGETAYLSVTTTYDVVTAENAQLYVTRESLCFEADGYYECFFLTAQNATVEQTSYEVTDRERVRKRLKRFRLLKLLIIGPLFETIGDFLVDVVLSSGCSGILFSIAAFIGLIVVASLYDLWGYVLLAALAYWLIMVVGELIADKSWGRITKKAGLNETSSLQDLDQWCDPKFIADYFSTPERVPYTGKIER